MTVPAGSPPPGRRVQRGDAGSARSMAAPAGRPAAGRNQPQHGAEDPPLDSGAMPSLLAFDTATERMSVALQVEERVFSYDGTGGASASATLLPAIQRLLDEAGIGLRQLDAIAFGRGPGAFTGLRTACSVAQGLAFGAGLPVVPVDTLLAVAEDARCPAHAGGLLVDTAGGGAGGGGPAGAGTVGGALLSLWVVMDARMDEIYAAHYEFSAVAGWQTRLPPLLATPNALNERWRTAPPRALAGSALAAFGERLQCGAAIRFADARPAARAMLPLAATLWQQGGALDAAQALPLYVRDKVAQTTAERAAGVAPSAALQSLPASAPSLPAHGRAASA